MPSFGNFHNFPICFRFEGDSHEEYAEAINIMFLEELQSKVGKQITPTHIPSLPQMVCTLSQIHPQLYHALARKGDKKVPVSDAIWRFDLPEHDLV